MPNDKKKERVTAENPVWESHHLGDDQRLARREKEIVSEAFEGKMFDQVRRELKKQGEPCEKDCY